MPCVAYIQQVCVLHFPSRGKDTLKLSGGVPPGPLKIPPTYGYDLSGTAYVPATILRPSSHYYLI